MELKTDEIFGKGASLPYNKVENVFTLYDELFSEFLTFNEFKYFLVSIAIIDEEETIGIPKKHMKDTFIVECKYPLSRFSDLLLSERVLVFTRLILDALYRFYEYHDLDVREIDLIKEKLQSCSAI